jgi:ABC-type glycerol-3-phosphate transport system substrate-binding protein
VTWDEVLDAAATITEKTDAFGFQVMTTENTGGWVLSTLANGFGGRFTSDDGTKALIDSQPVKDGLEFYRALRWDKNAAGDNFLIAWGDTTKDFAAGKTAMIVIGPDAINAVVNDLGFDVNNFGVGTLPQGPNGIGTLGGGIVTVVSANSTPEQISAATKWIEYHRLLQYTDESVAVQKAKDAIAAGTLVNVAALPLVNSATYAEYLDWIKDYTNVPTANFADQSNMHLIPEPPIAGQEIYAALDPVVQAVLTRQDADIDQLLADAQVTVQAILDNAQ